MNKKDLEALNEMIKYKKALEIIKEKRVDIRLLFETFNYRKNGLKAYNGMRTYGYALTQEEYDLLKEVLFMSEMEKLQKWLDENNIKYERYVEYGRFNRNQIIVKTDKIELSFICHCGSYGYQQGLIEMYDFKNEPIGFLNAEECISKLKEVLL